MYNEIELGAIEFDNEIELGDVIFDVEKVYPELENLEVTPMSIDQEFESKDYYGYKKVFVKKVEGGSAINQIYRGSIKPLDPNILIWIDTSGTTPVKKTLLTENKLTFKTSDDKLFILKEE